MNQDPAAARNNATPQQDEPNGDDAVEADDDAALQAFDENGIEALEDDIEL